MLNDRIRQKMKTAGKNLRDIVRERNEFMAAYALAMCSIKQTVDVTILNFNDLKKQHESRAKEYAAKHQDELLSRGWKNE